MEWKKREDIFLHVLQIIMCNIPIICSITMKIIVFTICTVRETVETIVNGRSNCHGQFNLFRRNQVENSQGKNKNIAGGDQEKKKYEKLITEIMTHLDETENKLGERSPQMKKLNGTVDQWTNFYCYSQK